MVCVEIDEAGYDGGVVGVVLADQHDDIGLARDFRGHFLVYDNAITTTPCSASRPTNRPRAA